MIHYQYMEHALQLPMGSEVLQPRRSILVCTGIGTPEANLVDDIGRQVQNIQIEGTVVIQDPEKEMDDLAKRLDGFQHGVLAMHREGNGIKGAMLAATMAARLKGFDIAEIDGGWDRKQGKFAYSVSRVITTPAGEPPKP